MNYLLNKFLPRIDFESYEDFHDHFTINVPEDFNFGFDVVDAWAEEEPDKRALLWVNEQDEERTFTFTDIKRLSNRVANFFRALGLKKGDVVVLPGRGITGTPGMGGVGLITFALEGAGMRKDIAIITDGHTSGLCNAALMAVDISPEANKGGVIGLIRDGDMIVIDAVNKRVDVELTDEEIEERRRTTPFVSDNTTEKGWLKIVQEMAQPLNKGGVII